MRTITAKLLTAVAVTGLLFAAAAQPKPKPKPKAPAKPAQHKSMKMPAAKSDTAKFRMVEVSTVYGNMIFKLYNETPLHRDNFVKLVQQGFYDSLLFHRVIPTFMIQGGDPLSKHAEPGTMLGNGDVGYRIPAEFNPGLLHKRGALAAARDDNPERASSGCQFYIVQGRRYKPEELVNIRNSVNYNTKQKMLQTVMSSDTVKARVDDFVLRGDKEGVHKYMLSLQPKIDSMYAKTEIVQTPFQLTTYTTVGGAPHLDMNYTVFGEMLEGFHVLDSIAAVRTDANNRPLTDVRMKIRMLK